MKTLLALFLFVGVPLAFLGILFLIGCKKSRYLQDMVFLEAYIKRSKPTKENFNFIYERFMEINENNWNYKRTAIVDKRFKVKYATYFLESKEKVTEAGEMKKTILKAV